MYKMQNNEFVKLEEETLIRPDGVEREIKKFPENFIKIKTEEEEFFEEMQPEGLETDVSKSADDSIPFVCAGIVKNEPFEDDAEWENKPFDKLKEEEEILMSPKEAETSGVKSENFIEVKTEEEEFVEEMQPGVLETDVNKSADDSIPFVCTGIVKNEVNHSAKDVNFITEAKTSTKDHTSTIDMNETNQECKEISITNSKLGRKLLGNCEHCLIEFNKKMFRHMKEHVATEPFSCSYCNYTSARRSDLLIHEQEHIAEEKPFKCNFCNFDCCTIEQLNSHKRTHTGEKLYCSCTSAHVSNKWKRTSEFKCDICDYKCSAKSRLVLHTRKHTGEKPFKCDLCDYKSSTKNCLVIHTRKHTGEKPFTCDLCDYKCSVKSRLVRHTRKHTGEKPFTCDLCDYRDSTKSNLIIHTRKHTGEKPFECTLCDYKCSRKVNLVKHTRKHTGEKPFECDLCDCKFSLKSSLVRHARKHTCETD